MRILQIFTFPPPQVISCILSPLFGLFTVCIPICMGMNKGRFSEPEEKGGFGWWQIKNLLPLRGEKERTWKSSQEAVLAYLSINSEKRSLQMRKRPPLFFSSLSKNLVSMTSHISCSFSLSERYYQFRKCSFYLFFSCRLLVEKIFAQYLVPHNLETEERMKCLYYLYASLDPNAVKWV